MVEWLAFGDYRIVDFGHEPRRVNSLKVHEVHLVERDTGVEEDLAELQAKLRLFEQMGFDDPESNAPAFRAFLKSAKEGLSEEEIDWCTASFHHAEHHMREADTTRTKRIANLIKKAKGSFSSDDSVGGFDDGQTLLDEALKLLSK